MRGVFNRRLTSTLVMIQMSAGRFSQNFVSLFLKVFSTILLCLQESPLRLCLVRESFLLLGLEFLQALILDSYVIIWVKIFKTFFKQPLFIHILKLQLVKFFASLLISVILNDCRSLDSRNVQVLLYGILRPRKFELLYSFTLGEIVHRLF